MLSKKTINRWSLITTNPKKRSPKSPSSKDRKSKATPNKTCSMPMAHTATKKGKRSNPTRPLTTKMKRSVLASSVQRRTQTTAMTTTLRTWKMLGVQSRRSVRH